MRFRTLLFLSAGLMLIGGCVLKVPLLSFTKAIFLKGDTSSHWGAGDSNLCVEDVVWSVDRLRKYGDVLGFYIGDTPPLGDWQVLSGGLYEEEHWQGVQRLSGTNNQYMVVTCSRLAGSGKHGGFSVVRFSSRERNGLRFRSNRLLPDTNVQDTGPPDTDTVVHYEVINEGNNPVYEHAGGIQVIGEWLVVPLSSKEGRGRVVFYDMSDPYNPKKQPYKIDLTNSSASAVAITKLQSGRYLLAIAGSEAKKIRFYVSQQTSLHTNPQFELFDIWDKGEIKTKINDKNWGEYQSINLVNQSDGRIFLLGLHNAGLFSTKDALGEDWVDVFRLKANTVTREVDLIKVANAHLYTNWSMRPWELRIPNQANLDAAGGVYVDTDGRLIVYATEHCHDGPFGSVKCMEFRNERYPTSCAVIQDAWVELYQDDHWDNRSLMIDFYDRTKESYNDFDGAEEFGDQPSSIRWGIPSGYRYVLFEHNTYHGSSLPLYGTDGYESIANLDDYDFGDAASSGRFEGRCGDDWIPIWEPRLIGSFISDMLIKRILIAGDPLVPTGERCVLGPDFTVIFKKGTSLTAWGTLLAYGQNGTISLVACDKPDRGIFISGKLRVGNGGKIVIY